MITHEARAMAASTHVGRNLRCPECGAEEIDAVWDKDSHLVVVLFKCAFSATFDDNLSEKQMQEKLDEFKKSGKMEEWLKRGMF